jgi:DNA repair exonuclease SbcCD ATPase subunit
MIKFETLRWKNFLSTGDNWTEVHLTKTKSTLIVGQNGAGKSTMLDALSFALFGKPHRNINKPQLVNTINQKNCSVEVEFIVGKSQFKVVRGIKPQVFEIWKNGTLLNQDSHAKEYQKILEQNILKLNHKSFHQIVVLGSSSFVPFMQLPAQHRRDVIEDLLDINVFSKMNTLIKEKQSILKETLKDKDHQLELLKNRIDSQKKYIRDITAMNEEEIAQKRTQIDEANGEINKLQSINSDASSYIEKHAEETSSRLASAHDKKQNLLQYRAQFNTQIKTVVRDTKFYEENQTCPSCEQEITEETRSRKLKEGKNKASELHSAIRKLEEEGGSLTTLLDELNTLSQEIKDKQTSTHVNNQTIQRLQKTISSLEDDIVRLTGREGDLGKANQELSDMNSDRSNLMEEKLKLNEEFSYNTVMGEMLKDTGIKTKVIKQYIPVINNLVNKYLQILDFFVHFNLDESFNETIRSRHRDAFSYDSFSEGEKQRIDLALLFTWRMIAKMKNSVATNLLVLDETFDSSLDHDGVDNLMKILYSLEDDTNTFVISHKGEILDGKFQNKLEFYKEKNFSRLRDNGLQMAS